MPKPFLTYQQQINKLTQEKNLIINNADYAEEYLKRISYFALISGYKDMYKDPTTRRFKTGTSFEEIVALYEFDEELRHLFLRYILKIEKHLRSLISYYFTEQYGESEKEYLDKNHYNNTPENSQEIIKLVTKLDKLCHSYKYAHIAHHRKNHNNVPLWVLVTVMTFGSLSKMYQYLPQNLRSKTAQNFDKVNQKQLQQFLSVLTSYRNFCAHGERLFSRQVKERIPDTDIHIKLSIPKDSGHYKNGKNDLFSIVIAFLYLLPREDFISFKKELKKLIDYYLSRTSHITEMELLSKMGFPANWKDITRYKK